MERDVQELFAEAGRRLGAGLHLAYVKRRTRAKSRPPSVILARAELCVLTFDVRTQDDLERIAGAAVKEWWAKHHNARLELTPERQAEYARVNRMAPAPEAEYLQLQPTITVTRGPRAWQRHLYSDEAGDFFPSPKLTGWEELTIEAELAKKSHRGWLRNPPRKEWSLGVPYDETGIPAVMYPDFLSFRTTSGGIVVDVLEPHAANQADLAPKLQASASSLPNTAALSVG